MVQEPTGINAPFNGSGQRDRGSRGIRSGDAQGQSVWVAAIRQQMVNAEAKEQREQNEGPKAHLKTKRFGWIGGLGSTLTFAIEWFGG
jgi:hypothetical protein